MPGLVGLVVIAGFVVVVPLGLSLLAGQRFDGVRRAWPAAGLLAGAGLLMPRGAVALATALPLAVLCAAVSAHGLRHVLTHAPAGSGVERLVHLTATGSLSVAAGSLLAERAGYRALGFDLDVLGLTVAHFVFAGFAAVVLAGLTARVAPGTAARTGAVTLPVGTALVAAGHFAGPALELLGAVVVAVGLLATSWVVLTRVAPVAPDRRARALLRTAALATPFTMALALWWAGGELTGLPHPTLTQTAATHGVLNALAVALGGLLGYRLLAPDGATPEPAPYARLGG